MSKVTHLQQTEQKEGWESAWHVGFQLFGISKRTQMYHKNAETQNEKVVAGFRL